MHGYEQTTQQQPQGGAFSGGGGGGAAPAAEQAPAEQAPVQASGGAGAGTSAGAGAAMSHWAEDGGGAGTAGGTGGGTGGTGAGSGLSSPRFQGEADFEAALAGKKALRPGWGNAGAVMKLQQALTGLGYDLGTVDGQWGGKTTAAVKGFQGNVGASPDGVIGPQTMRSLDQADAGGGPGRATGQGGGQGGEQTGGQGGGQTGHGGGQTAGGQTGHGGGQTGHGGQGGQQTDGPQGGDKAQVTPVPAADPAKAAEEEEKFAAEGQGAITAIKDQGGPQSAGGGGHTQGGPVAGFPDWFSQLQEMLVRSASWGQTEEKAQNVLYRYGMWKTQLTKGKVPPNIEVFFRYIGRSQANDESARKGGFKSTNEIGGKAGNKNWCQAATTAAVEIALAERGLKFKGGAVTWINQGWTRKGVKTYWSKSAHQVELSPGDWVSYVSPFGPETGHAITVLDVNGDTFQHTSGNAGGGSARVGQSKRGVPPDNYSIDAVVNWKAGQREQPAVTRPTKDEVWTFSVTKVSNMFAELERVDQVDPASPEYAAVLKDLGLERMK